jgi:hypothetical protein
MVNSDQLIQCRHCGQKTINEILTIQSGIKSFILHQIDEKGFLKPEELIKAPVSTGSPLLAERRTPAIFKISLLMSIIPHFG